MNQRVVQEFFQISQKVETLVSLHIIHCRESTDPIHCIMLLLYSFCLYVFILFIQPPLTCIPFFLQLKRQKLDSATVIVSIPYDVT